MSPRTQEKNDAQKRLLYITKDSSVMQEGSVAYARMTDMRALFLEIHIIVLHVPQRTADIPVMNPFENVWLYPTNSASWRKTPFDAYTIAQTELVFGGVFRVDIIVADDPFVSGLAGWFLSKKFTCPFQLHITEDFFDDSYTRQFHHPIFYRWSVAYLLARVKSVRTKTEHQQQEVIAMNPDLASVTEVLPSYYDLEVWRDFTPTINLQEEYPQFKFIILHISSMQGRSRSEDVLASMSSVLRLHPSVGLIMVGNGPLRGRLERQVIAFGLQNQVEFEPMPSEVVSHLKSAHLLIHLCEDGSEDDCILEGAVSKIPLIASTASLAGKLFTDGASAYLCAPGDVACIAEKVTRYLNENHNRTQFALAASDIVFEQIEQDYSAYLQAYGESMERCIAPASYI